MSNDDQLAEQLRRMATRSMERRAAAVDTDAGLNDHRVRLDSLRVPNRRDRRWHAAAAAVVVVAAGITAIAWPRGSGEPETDARPLVERLEALGEEPASFSVPWWRGAVEASPATHFTLDGEEVDAPDLFVVGEVVAVNGLTGFSSNEGPLTVDDLVGFNSSDAVIDIVVVTIEVDDGVAENDQPLPDQVDFVLGLPAPTDLPSLEQELSGRVGAILFRIQYLEQTLAGRLEGDLYDVLDGHFLGRVQADELVFGEFFPPAEFLGAETVRISEVIAGAGDIEMVTRGGVPTRVG